MVCPDSDREDEDSGAGSGVERGITLSGLLNALDGVASPYGTITVMTTNYPERLDRALVRSGRVDLEFSIGELTDDQLIGLYEVAFDRKPPSPFTPLEKFDFVEHARPTASDVVGVLQRTVDQSNGHELAWYELEEMLVQRSKEFVS